MRSCCVAQGTNGIWSRVTQHDGGECEKESIRMCDWVAWLYSGNGQNIVHQLYLRSKQPFLRFFGKAHPGMSASRPELGRTTNPPCQGVW